MECNSSPSTLECMPGSKTSPEGEGALGPSLMGSAGDMDTGVTPLPSLLFPGFASNHHLNWADV